MENLGLRTHRKWDIVAYEGRPGLGTCRQKVVTVKIYTTNFTAWLCSGLSMTGDGDHQFSGRFQASKHADTPSAHLHSYSAHYYSLQIVLQHRITLHWCSCNTVFLFTDTPAEYHYSVQIILQHSNTLYKYSCRTLLLFTDTPSVHYFISLYMFSIRTWFSLYRLLHCRNVYLILFLDLASGIHPPPPLAVCLR